MSLICITDIIRTYKIKKRKIFSHKLNYFLNSIKELYKKRDFLKGNITLEGSIIIPLFMFFSIMLISIGQVELINGKVLSEMVKVSDKLSSYGAIYNDINGEKYGEILEFSKDFFTLEYIKNYVNSNINTSYLDGDISFIGNEFIDKDGNINILGVDLIDDKGNINLIASYKIKMPFNIFGVDSIKQKTSLTTHMFVGYIDEEDSKDDGEYVYVAENGSVYHKNINCTHLTLSIEEIEINDLKNKRNENGGKYYKCSSCGRGSGSTIFITKEGNKYHYNRSCHGLKRTARKVKLSDVENLNPCSRCGG